MCTGIYTAKWFLQCFIDQTPFLLTLKLWDAYILDGERVLSAMAYTILKMHSTGPEEFPTKPLGLEEVSPAPKPRLPSCVETLPRVDGPASPGPATQQEQPGPLPGQAILKAEEPLQEGTSTEPSAAPLQPGGPRAQVLARLPPAQDPLLARLSPQQWNSLPNLPVYQEGAGRWPPDVGSKPQHWVPFRSAPAWATPVGTPQTRPQNAPGTLGTGSPQPRKEEAVGPRTPFLPCGHCSSCPFRG
nr:carabin-like isoform X3 [Halichoerus grypus]